jgi:hypothetical protein
MKTDLRFSRKSVRMLRLVLVIISINSLSVSAIAQNGPHTIFQASDVPANPNVSDNKGIELGTKFRTFTNGFITGVRFYKGALNTGTHIGHLWSSDGTMLAEATFTNESASGWQEVILGTPVAVSAATTYVVSYYSPSYFAMNANYFTSAVVNDPLRALANGEDGPNGVFIYSSSPAFPNNTGNGSNYWADIVFKTTINDGIPPTITDISATPHTDGTTTVTWTTDEASDSRVDYGTTENSLNLSTNKGSLVTNHTVTLSGLAEGATYYFRVTSADASTNSATKPVNANSPLSFVMPVVCASDQNYGDFSLGMATNTFVSEAGGGQVILKPRAVAEFSVLPPETEWKGFNWPNGGSATVSGGLLTLDAVRFNSEPETSTFGPGTTLDFVATFSAAKFQHIGFGGGTDAGTTQIFNGGPWAMFSTGSDGAQLYARTLNGSDDISFGLGNAYLGSPHHYKIEWTASDLRFYIDGSIVRTESVAITGPMRPAISDLEPGGGVVTVDWIHVSPYAASGTFTSQVFGGETPTAWGKVSVTANIPAGTTLTTDIRTGNTPIPDDRWTDFTTIADGEDITAASKYIQYRANLTTNDPAITPVLKVFSISDCSTCRLKIEATPTPVSCNGAMDGSITVSATKGTLPYKYKLGANGNFQPSSTFSNLRAKDYAIFVMDAKGCTKVVKVTVNRPTPISVSVVNQTSVSCIGKQDGSVTVTASGGPGTSFHYRKGKNGALQSSGFFDHLRAGDHKIFAISDNGGCTGFVIVTIADGPSCDGAVSKIADLNDAPGSNDFSIKVFPNPAVSEFTLALNGSVKGNVEIKVTDMFGKAVYSTNGSAAKLYRFGSELPGGVYILQVITGSQSKSVKIIKQ